MTNMLHLADPRHVDCGIEFVNLVPGFRAHQPAPVVEAHQLRSVTIFEAAQEDPCPGSRRQCRDEHTANIQSLRLNTSAFAHLQSVSIRSRHCESRSGVYGTLRKIFSSAEQDTLRRRCQRNLSLVLVP